MFWDKFPRCIRLRVDTVPKATPPRLPCGVHFLLQQRRPRVYHVLSTFICLTAPLLPNTQSIFCVNQSPLELLQGKNWLKANSNALRFSAWDLSRGLNCRDFAFSASNLGHWGAKGRFVLGIDCEMVYAKESVLWGKASGVLQFCAPCRLALCCVGWQGCACTSFSCQLLRCHLRCAILSWPFPKRINKD